MLGLQSHLQVTSDIAVTKGCWTQTRNSLAPTFSLKSAFLSDLLCAVELTVNQNLGREHLADCFCSGRQNK